jgi:hypothetical protein
VDDNGTGVYVPYDEDVAVTISDSTITRNSGDGVSVGSDIGGQFDVVNDHITNNGGMGCLPSPTRCG